MQRSPLRGPHCCGALRSQIGPWTWAVDESTARGVTGLTGRHMAGAAGSMQPLCSGSTSRLGRWRKVPSPAQWMWQGWMGGNSRYLLLLSQVQDAGPCATPLDRSPARAWQLPGHRQQPGGQCRRWLRASPLSWWCRRRDWEKVLGFQAGPWPLFLQGLGVSHVLFRGQSRDCTYLEIRSKTRYGGKCL